MATLDRLNFGAFRVHFRFGDKRSFRSLETNNEKTAAGMLASIEETLDLIKTGRRRSPLTWKASGRSLYPVGK